jgi:hypothetical protein
MSDLAVLASTLEPVVEAALVRLAIDGPCAEVERHVFAERYWEDEGEDFRVQAVGERGEVVLSIESGALIEPDWFIPASTILIWPLSRASVPLLKRAM